MKGRVRRFLWRHQRSLALSYVGLVAFCWLAFLGFAYGAPRGLDTSIAVASRTLAFGAPAPRPLYSVLDLSSVEEAIGRPMPDWKDGLGRYLARYK